MLFKWNTTPKYVRTLINLALSPLICTDNHDIILCSIYRGLLWINLPVIDCQVIIVPRNNELWYGSIELPNSRPLMVEFFGAIEDIKQDGTPGS